MRRVTAMLASICFVVYSAVLAQLPQAPVFEVASVRLTEPSAPLTPRSMSVTSTRVDIVNMSLQPVLRMAFRVKESQLIAPSWLSHVRVHIQATLPGSDSTTGTSNVATATFSAVRPRYTPRVSNHGRVRTDSGHGWHKDAAG